MESPRRMHVLIYDYPSDVLTRRAPHRPLHLELVDRWCADGRLVLAGATGDPATGGLLVFDVADPAEVEQFVAEDPYVANGVITAHRVEPWLVVGAREGAL